MQEGLTGHACVEVGQRALANRVHPANVSGARDANLPVVDQRPTAGSYATLRLAQARSIDRPTSNCKDAAIDLTQQR
ncbi:hypothetical protein G6F23_016057 [Rhizopus arrhizus]|nr:hypothetical protein G6F23_016057 [Rhizopus arrhizus]